MPPTHSLSKALQCFRQSCAAPRAIHVNIEIMRTFVRLRQLLFSNKELAQQLVALEEKYDAQFKVVFEAIRELMKPPEVEKRHIEFAPWDE